MYGHAEPSTRQVSAATGANATTPMTSIIAVAASGSRVRPPSRTLPVPWSHAAAKASRNAETGTARPYLRAGLSSRCGAPSARATRRARARAAARAGPPAPAGSPRAPEDETERREGEQCEEEAADQECSFHASILGLLPRSVVTATHTFRRGCLVSLDGRR